MSKIIDIAKKIGSSFNSGNHSEKVKMTPEEVELASYKRREYHDNVKKELHQYRDRNKYLTTEQDRKILLSGNVFKHDIKTKPIMNGENIFRRKYGKA